MNALSTIRTGSKCRCSLMPGNFLRPNTPASLCLRGGTGQGREAILGGNEWPLHPCGGCRPEEDPEKHPWPSNPSLRMAYLNTNPKKETSPNHGQAMHPLPSPALEARGQGSERVVC